jgi:hypothetical protein
MHREVLRKSPKDLQSNTHLSESEYPQEAEAEEGVAEAEEGMAEAAVETV